jgi:rubrerythrin
MQNMKNQLLKTLRHEEAVLNYYNRTINEITIPEVRKYFTEAINAKETQIERIKGLLKKHCST